MKRLKEIDGLPVVDAKKPVTLQVTKRDISHADVKDPANCAAARACTRQLGTEARIHLSRVYLKQARPRRWDRYVTPPQLRNELIAFDRGGTFAPGAFVLWVPQPTQQLGARPGRPSGNTAHPKRRRGYHRVTDVRVHA